MEGTQLGSYKILRQLGKGGMGIVYEAEHVLIGKRAAVKTLRAELSANRDTVQRFFNEARATTQIHHPGIVDVFDFGFATDGTAFLVMELLEGESLAARRRRAPMTLALVLAIIRQVASAVEAAHAKGIVHRDLKPDNLFLVPHADMPAGVQCKVLDFGIAKLHQSQAPDVTGSPATRTGALLGTPLYMSPEQCRGIATVDHRADIYSLGCIFYELIAGRPPFGGEGVGDILIAHVHEVPRDPSAEHPELPTDVVALAGHMLSKKPASRPRSMSAVIEQLDRIVAALGDQVELTLAWASGGGIDPMAATSASTDRDADPMAATATPTERTAPPSIAEAVAPTTERRDPTPVAPTADTTLGASAGTTTREPTPRSRRAILLGGGAALALGGVYGASRLLRGGATAPPAPPKPPSIVRLGFRLPATTTELPGEPILMALPENRDPVKLRLRKARLDTEIARSVVVLVEATERYLGTDDQDVDDSLQIDGARQDVLGVLDHQLGWAQDVRLVLFSQRADGMPPRKGTAPWSSMFPSTPASGVFGSDLVLGLRRALSLVPREGDRHLLLLGTGSFLQTEVTDFALGDVLHALQRKSVHASAIVGDWIDDEVHINFKTLHKVFADVKQVKQPSELADAAITWASGLPRPWTIDYELPDGTDSPDALFTMAGISRTVQLVDDDRIDLGDSLTQR